MSETLAPPPPSAAPPPAGAAAPTSMASVPVQLGTGIRRGIFWHLVGQSAARILNLLFLVVLARLLDPRDYGLFSLANIVLGFAAAFSSFGLGSAVIQRIGPAVEAVSGAFYLNLLFTSLMGGLLMVAAPAVADFYGEPLVGSILVVLSVGFVARSTCSIHEAFLRKRLAFGRLQVAIIGSTLVYGLVAIFVAWQGLGAWSFAYAFLASSAVLASSLWLLSGMPLQASLHLAEWRSLLSYSKFIFLSSCLWYLIQQGDAFTVGKFLGASALGAYALAANFSRVPMLMIGGAIGDVLFSALSRLQKQPEAIRLLVQKSVRLAATLAFPIGALLFVTSEDLFNVLFGEKWSAAIPAFRILAPATSVLMVGASFPALYQALGKPKINLFLAVATLPVFIAAIALGLRYGIVGISAGVAAVSLLLLVAHFPIVSSLTGTGIGRLVGQLLPGLVGTGIAFAIVWAAGPGLQYLPTEVRLGATAIGLPAIYFAVLRAIFPRSWKELRQFIVPVLGNSRAGL